MISMSYAPAAPPAKYLIYIGFFSVLLCYLGRYAGVILTWCALEYALYTFNTIRGYQGILSAIT